jgi:hypothetical protein
MAVSGRKLNVTGGTRCRVWPTQSSCNSPEIWDHSPKFSLLESREKDRNVELQQFSLQRRPTMHVILSACVVVKLKCALIARGKIVNGHKENLLKHDLAEAILTEPEETRVKFYT